MLKHSRFGHPFRNLFLAPENGPSGGGNPGAKPTIEDRLATAEQARDQHAKDLAEANGKVTGLTKERDDAKAESTRLAGLFESATKTASDAQAALKLAQDSLTTMTGERDALTGKLTTADANVSRLEALCGIKGVDASAAVPAPKPGQRSASNLYDQWQELKKSDPVKATAFFRKHQAEMRAAA